MAAVLRFLRVNIESCHVQVRGNMCGTMCACSPQKDDERPRKMPTAIASIGKPGRPILQYGFVSLICGWVVVETTGCVVAERTAVPTKLAGSTNDSRTA